jgi:hypothetical protein
MNTKFFSGVMNDLARNIPVGQKKSKLGHSANKFAGKWSGTMYFANSSGKADIVIIILTRCKPGDVCGNLENKTSDFICELTLDEVNGDVLSYTFSKSLRGEGPMGSSGKLILRPDGTLYRVHQTPGYIVSGTLRRSDTE